MCIRDRSQIREEMELLSEAVYNINRPTTDKTHSDAALVETAKDTVTYKKE